MLLNSRSELLVSDSLGGRLLRQLRALFGGIGLCLVIDKPADHTDYGQDAGERIEADAACRLSLLGDEPHHRIAADLGSGNWFRLSVVNGSGGQRCLCGVYDPRRRQPGRVDHPRTGDKICRARLDVEREFRAAFAEVYRVARP